MRVVSSWSLTTQQPALRLLRRISAVRPDLLHAAARHAALLEPVPGADEVRAWIDGGVCTVAPVLDSPLDTARTLAFSLADGATATRFGSGVDGATGAWRWMTAEQIGRAHV